MAAFAFLGEAHIDLTHASFGEDGVEITAQAILGVVNIVVPPDARVTMTGFPLVGSLSPTREPGPPTVRTSRSAPLLCSARSPSTAPRRRPMTTDARRP